MGLPENEDLLSTIAHYLIIGGCKAFIFLFCSFPGGCVVIAAVMAVVYLFG